jgi:hypothetical protein
MPAKDATHASAPHAGEFQSFKGFSLPSPANARGWLTSPLAIGGRHLCNFASAACVAPVGVDRPRATGKRYMPQEYDKHMTVCDKMTVPKRQEPPLAEAAPVSRISSWFPVGRCVPDLLFHQMPRRGCSASPPERTDPIAAPGFSLDIGSPPFCWLLTCLSENLPDATIEAGIGPETQWIDFT